jgi:hypothetical protein
MAMLEEPPHPSIRDLPDEEDPVVAKHHPAHVDLGRGVPIPPARGSSIASWSTSPPAAMVSAAISRTRA